MHFSASIPPLHPLIGGRAPGVLVVLLGCLSTIPAGAGEHAPPTARGDVSGAIYSIGTGLGVAGARVTSLGESTDVARLGTTDAGGAFRARVALGTVRRRFDRLRLLALHPVSLLAGPSVLSERTQSLDVTTLALRVAAPGFKTFEGRVRSAVADAERFRLTLDPIWLVPEDEEGCSFTAEAQRLEVVEGLDARPPVAAPGESVRITLRLRVPQGTASRYRAYLSSSAPRLIPSEKEFSVRRVLESGVRPEPREAVHPRMDVVEYAATVRLPPNTGDRHAELGFALLRSDGVSIRKQGRVCHVLVAGDPERRRAAELLLEALALRAVGRAAAATRALEQAALVPHPFPLALRLCGESALAAGRSDLARRCYEALAAEDPDDYQYSRPGLAALALANGDPAAALRSLRDAEKAVGRERVPGKVHLLRARCYSRLGDFARVDEALGAAAGGIEDASALAEIETLRLRAELERRPDDPYVHLSLARALERRGLLGEARSHALSALGNAPDSPWPRIDLSLILGKEGRRAAALSALREAARLAPENPSVWHGLADAFREAGDYRAALQAYRRAGGEDSRGDPATALWSGALSYATGDEGRAATVLRDLTTRHRGRGEIREDGLPLPGFGIYWGPRRRTLAGYTRPEMSAAAELLAAIEGRRSGETGLGRQDSGRALLSLGLAEAAVADLERARHLAPGLPETRYLLGLALRQTGDPERARSALEDELRLNPRHPRARLVLARLLAELGRPADAALAVSAHRRHYPYDDIAATLRSVEELE